MPALHYPVVMLDFGKIRTLREAAGLNQEQAAKKAGIGSKSRWADIESGARANITIDTLDRIAAALDVEPADLLVKVKAKRGSK